MPRRRWKPADQMTPFARALLAHMREQWPQLSVPEMARRGGVSTQSVYDWFDRDIIPRASTIDVLAQAMDWDANALRAAAGYPAAPPVVPPLAEVLDALIREYEQDPLIQNGSRQRAIEVVRGFKARYGAEYHPSCVDRLEPTDPSAVDASPIHE